MTQVPRARDGPPKVQPRGGIPSRPDDTTRGRGLMSETSITRGLDVCQVSHPVFTTCKAKSLQLPGLAQLERQAEWRFGRAVLHGRYSEAATHQTIWRSLHLAQGGQDVT